MITKRIPIPGDVYAVPLKRGGYGLILVARCLDVHLRENQNIFVYGFRHMYKTVPDAAVLDRINIFDAVYVMLSHDYTLRKKAYPYIGPLGSFDPTQWPVPPEIQISHMRSPLGSTMRMCVDPEVQQVYVSEDKYFKGNLMPNDGLIDPKDEAHFPYATGLGLNDVLEDDLDKAIRDKSRLHTFLMNERTLELWASVIAEVKRRGLYPKAVPYPKPIKRTKKKTVMTVAAKPTTKTTKKSTAKGKKKTTRKSDA